ncbi:MAG: beta-ketoacyl synthase N-terminal-like domain-containing protein [Albidovulum sp.]|uniref:type I polyketide synthase n=1 Tax=Albidovulum sp. TaxID=1872424 RepID=UPI003CC1057E
MSFDIAIIGLANRFPGAPDKNAFWRMLTAGDTSFEPLSPEDLRAAGASEQILETPGFVPVASMLDDIETFDADFFGIPAREALVLDPQHRLFLECVWEAFEDAGLDPARTPSVGVFAGASLNSYLIRNLSCNPQLLSTPDGFLSLISNEKDYLATRVSYKLNLHGPAITVQTACSTSLVAVHQALQSLLIGECDVAVAGGVSIKVPQKSGYQHREGMPFSADGSCRSFDADGSGTIFGSGAGVVVLKPLEDAQRDGDEIYCVIRASAMNNDGNRKVGFTAPSTDGQVEVIRRAVALSDCPAHSIDYVEAHATATPLGDPIEAAALAEVYGPDRASDAPLRIGSVKANIGHMETAAGVAGLIKTALMLKQGQLVPNPGFDTPNPNIDFDGWNMKVQTELGDWSASQTRRAGVSSFGMGGTNIHMVLESVPGTEPAKGMTDVPVARDELFVLSARSEAALAAMGTRLADWLDAHPDTVPATLAANLRNRRAALTHRQAFLASDIETATRKLRRTELSDNYFGIHGNDRKPVAFVYCGGGAQYPGMCAGLMGEPVFRDAVERVAAGFQTLVGHDLLAMLDAKAASDAALAERMQQPDIMFPALFTVQNAMGALMESWGLMPDLVMGHSNGEYAAAVRAGVMTEEAAIRLVAARSTLMLSMPKGGMISVAAPADALAEIARECGLSIGAANADDNTALSGPLAALDQAIPMIQEKLNLEARRLHVGAALHSHLTEAIAPDFTKAILEESFSPPRLRWISSVTGTFMDPGRAPDTNYWTAHLTGTVRFRDAADTFLSMAQKHVALDMGPNCVAGDLLRQNAQQAGQGSLQAVQAARSRSENTPDPTVARAALARCWALGADVAATAGTEDARVDKLDLPSYPWQRRRYWVDAPAEAGETANIEAAMASLSKASEGAEALERPALTSPYVAAETETEHRLLALWIRYLDDRQIGTADDFIELGGTSLLATEVVSAIRAEFDVPLDLGAFLEGKTIGAIARVIDTLTAEIDAALLREALAEISGKTDKQLEDIIATA